MRLNALNHIVHHIISVDSFQTIFQFISVLMTIKEQYICRYHHPPSFKLATRRTLQLLCNSLANTVETCLDRFQDLCTMYLHSHSYCKTNTTTCLSFRSTNVTVDGILNILNIILVLIYVRIWTRSHLISSYYRHKLSPIS